MYTIPAAQIVYLLQCFAAVVHRRRPCYNSTMEQLKENKLIRTVLIAAALLFAAVFALYAFFRAETVTGLAAAGASLLLFAMVCFKTFGALYCAAAEPALPSPDASLGRRSLRFDKRHPWLRILCFMVFTRLMLFAFAHVFSAGEIYEGGILDTMRTAWLRTDSPSYLGIAENWYVTEGDPRFHIVFFPLYPIFIRLFNFLTGNSFASAMVVSNLCALISAILVYEAAALDHDRETSLRAVKFTFLSPAAFFFAAPMTESLFLTFCLAAVLCVRKQKYFFGCLLAALAAFTRSLGALLIAFVFTEWLLHVLEARRLGSLKENRKAFTLRFFCMFLVPLGLLGYLYINYAVTGDPFRFMQYQQEHWNQGFGLFFETAAYQTDYLLSTLAEGDFRQAFGLWLPNLIMSFGSLVLMTLAAKKLRPSYSVFFIAYFVIAIGATWLLSAPRYLAGCFPLGIALAALADTKRKDAAATLLSFALLCTYLAMYVNGWPVY